MRLLVVLALLLVLVAGCAQEHRGFTLNLTETEQFSDVRLAVEKAGTDQRLVDTLNVWLRSPPDVEILFDECGRSDAYYEDGRITICYELLEHIARTHARTTGDDGLGYVANTVGFIILQQASLAIIDEYDLPVDPSRKDELTMLMVMESGEDTVLIPGIAYFNLQNRDSDYSDYWNSSSMTINRVQDMLCHAYGKNTTRFDMAITLGGLSAERAPSCQAEYDQMLITWREFLERRVHPLK